MRLGRSVPSGTRGVRVDTDAAVETGTRPGRAAAPPGLAGCATAARVGAPIDGLDYARWCVPEKIICVGLNYRDHIEETGRDTPESHPVAKFPARWSALRRRAAAACPTRWTGRLSCGDHRRAGPTVWPSGPPSRSPATACSTSLVRDYSEHAAVAAGQDVRGPRRSGHPGEPDELPGGGPAIDAEIISEVDARYCSARPPAVGVRPCALVRTFGDHTLRPGDVIAPAPRGVGHVRKPALPHEGRAHHRIAGVGECRTLRKEKI